MNKNQFPIHKISHFEKELSESLITPELANEILISEFSLDKKQEVANLINRDISRMPKGPWLVYPYIDLIDRNKIVTFNMKSAVPLKQDGDEQKYLREAESKNYLYFLNNIPPEVYMDNLEPVGFVEGEKKTICANQHGFLTIGLNGVHNWITDGLPLEVFSKLNLKGRQVWIGFDSDKVANPKVKKAEDKFVTYLQSMGAKVRLLKLPYVEGEKCGVDDYILKNGADEFRNLLKQAGLPPQSSVKDIEEYLSDLNKLSIEERDNKIKSAVPAIATKGDSIIESILKDYISNPKVRDITSKLIQDLRKEEKKEVEYVKNKESKRHVIYHDSSLQHIHSLLNTTHEHMLSTGRYFLEDKELRYINGKDFVYINKSNLSSVLEATTEFKINGEYKPLPHDYSGIIIAGPERKKLLPEMFLYTDTITYTKEWKLVKSGFNKDSGIYYSGTNIIPNKKLKLLHEVFNKDYCFSNNASRTNAYASIFTAFLRHMWPGAKPFFAIMGNQPGIGKSTISKTVTILMTGLKEDKPIMFTTDEAELEKRVASKILNKVDILNFDNIKLKKELESGVLEMVITSMKPSFRLMGGNEMLEKYNTFITFISLNDAKLGRDMLTRMCPVEMFYPDDPAKRVFERPDPEEWAFQNREAIIAEIAGAIENWKDLGCPLVKSLGRFGLWYSVIGGILMANGFKDFMTNFQEATTTYTAEAREAGALFYECINEWKTVPELISLCTTNNIFKEKMTGSGAGTALTLALNKLVKNELPLPDGLKFTLEKQTAEENKERKVKFRGVCANHPNTKPDGAKNG